MTVVRARKRFGQHFLADRHIIDRIVALIAPTPGDHFVEIGPGRRALTDPLVKSGARVTAIELDRDLLADLAAAYRDEPRFALVAGDALEVDYQTLADEQAVRVVGNLPYNISTPLLMRLLAQSQRVDDMTFMLQDEVVARLAALPDTKAYGRLSIVTQSLCRVDAEFEVPPTAFRPPPRVLSRMVRIKPYAAPLSPAEHAALQDCARIAFSQRRKTLRHTLVKAYGNALLEQCDIDPGARPGEIDVPRFVRLARLIAATDA